MSAVLHYRNVGVYITMVDGPVDLYLALDYLCCVEL